MKILLQKDEDILMNTLHIQILDTLNSAINSICHKVRL